MLDSPIHKTLVNFLNHLDALAHCLPYVMSSTAKAAHKAQKKYFKYLSEKGTEQESEKEGVKKFAVPFKYDKKIQRKKRAFDVLDTSLELIPRNFLVSFVSEFDAFVGKIIRDFYLAKPDLLNGTERQIQFCDLAKFTHLDEAKEFILEKEIESLLRKSHAEQFSVMENKFGIPLTKNLDIWPLFIELTERRNLYVHCDGKVSSQYLQVCKKHGVELDPLPKVGDILQADIEYLANSYGYLYEIGFKLAHVLWRKLLPDDRANADESFLDLTYELLATEQYKLAQVLLDFSATTIKKYDSDINRRVLTVNRALAYKQDGNQEKCEEILNKDDWSSCNESLRLATAVLRDNYVDSLKIMKEIGPKGTVPEHCYEEWPLFNTIRDREDFQKTFEEIFGHPLESIAEVSSVEKNA